MKTFLKPLKNIFLLLLVGAGSFAQSNNGKENGSINITSFNVYAKENKICFDWSTDGATGTNVFEVQQSSDGIEFQTIAMVLGPDPKQKGDNYGCSLVLRKQDKNAKNYYRLKHIDNSGQEQIGAVKEFAEKGRETARN